MKKHNNNTSILGSASIKSAQNIESTQWTKYSNPKAHGWGAEDWNAIIDTLSGKTVNKVGINNELNGADRIVNGVKIQSKYCKTASDSVENAFKNGAYRYPGQKLEVPKGQGKEAVRIFQEKIVKGEVPGVGDPSMAREIVVEGHCTYEQAVKVTKAGNIESLKMDAMNHAVTCAYSAGLSFVITYAGCRAKGMDPNRAFKTACTECAITSILYLTTNVAVQQMLRTQPGRNIAAVATKGARRIVNSIGKSQKGIGVIKQIVAKQAGQEASEAAARVVATKMLRSNIITATAMTVAVSIPDVIRSASGKQSWKETGQNALVNTSGTCGGWGGALAGAAAGSMVCPGIGTTIGGIIGGIVGGMAAQRGMQKVIRQIGEAQIA